MLKRFVQTARANAFDVTFITSMFGLYAFCPCYHNAYCAALIAWAITVLASVRIAEARRARRDRETEPERKAAFIRAWDAAHGKTTPQ